MATIDRAVLAAVPLADVAIHQRPGRGAGGRHPAGVLAVVVVGWCRCGGCDEAPAGDDEAVIEAVGGNPDILSWLLRHAGDDEAVIEAVIRDDPEALLAFREAMKGKPGRPKGAEEPASNSRGIGVVHGTTRAYSLDRVNRECDPETVAAVMAGELSANAALVRSR